VDRRTALLEVQEYVWLLATSRGRVTPPFYYRDIVQQFDSIGIGSLTVVLLRDSSPGWCCAADSGITLDQFGARSMVGRLISASMSRSSGRC
jgi:ABC-type transporter Mla maintaining outer membrane lipid asymmetry permease subunit MlaE